MAGLTKSGTYGGKLYGIPYYAGSRVVTYRTDLFRRQIKKVPTSLAEFTLDAKKLGDEQAGRGSPRSTSPGPTGTSR